ncbi:MAG: RNA 2',3'-cyclic phosphodiesterase [Gammaproteobacteria bacterium]|jgi:2'-5' RNA ligase|nr:RNA 2',3'-cyclic phosphodiesterase [Gammaproteobacteria bacterium]
MVERLFFALWPPATLRDALVEWRARLDPGATPGPSRSQSSSSHPSSSASPYPSPTSTPASPRPAATAAEHRPERPPPRLTHPDDLHLTLVFVGAVEPYLRACIEAAGDDIACGRFELALEQVDSWTKQRIWVAQPRQVPNALFALVSQLQQNLLVCGLEPEKRRYRPHLTLARKAPAIEPEPVELRWPVSEFVLAASGSGRRPSYRIIRRWRLD